MKCPRKAVFLTDHQIDLLEVKTGKENPELEVIRLLMEKMPVEVLYDVAAGNPSMLSRIFSPLKHLDLAKDLEKRVGPEHILWVSCTSMSGYTALGKKLGFHVVLDYQQKAQETPSGDWIKPLHRSFLSSIHQSRPDAIITHTVLDTERVRKGLPGTVVENVPRFVETAEYIGLREKEGSTILFIGDDASSSGYTNFKWFMREVYARVKSVLGSGMPQLAVCGIRKDRLEKEFPEITSFESEKESVVKLVGNSMLAVASNTEYSPQIQRNVLRAMAAARTVVTTGAAAESLEVSPTYDIWIADDADAFASYLVRLCRNPDLRIDSGKNAARTIDTRYCSKLFREKLEHLLSNFFAKIGNG